MHFAGMYWRKLGTNGVRPKSGGIVNEFSMSNCDFTQEG